MNHMKNSCVVNVLLAVLCGLAPRLSEAATYYWDDNSSSADFGTAGANTGTWAAPTAGPTAGWSLSATGANIFEPFTTATNDALHFGNGATGLAAGTITISGTVGAGDMTFASGSGAIVLSGGTINLASTVTIAVSNTADTISSILTGAATSLTKAGAGTLTLSGDNTFAGNILISQGTLNADLKQAGANPTSGALGNAQTVGRTLTISAGATLNFTKGDVLGNENTSPNLTLIANGGTIKNTTTGPNSGFNLLGPVQLNGGTLSSTGGGYGDNYYAYPGFALGGTVTVGGIAVSTISTSGNYNSGATGSAAGIGLQTAAKGSTTFDVADAVSGSDLNVTGVLQNWGTNFPNNPGALIKTGIGTMTLSGANTYSGTTTISAGTLALGATNTLPSASAVAISNATLNVATYTNRVGTLTVTGSATINLGAGGRLAFAASTNLNWTGTLTITGPFVSGQSLRFGTNSLGLATAQLKKISKDGAAAFSLDDNGFLQQGSGGTLIMIY